MACQCAAANWAVLLLLLRDIKKPIPVGKSPYAGIQIAIAAMRPRLDMMVTFLQIGGPILGVIFVKVLVYGQIAARASEMSQATAAAHQILFSTISTVAFS